MMNLISETQISQMTKDELLLARKTLIAKINNFIYTTSGNSMLSPDVYLNLSQVDKQLAKFGFPQVNPFPSLESK